MEIIKCIFFPRHFIMMVLICIQPSLSVKTTTTVAPIRCPEDCSCLEDFTKLVCTDLDPKSIDSRLSSLTKQIKMKRDFMGPITNSTFRLFVSLETLDLSNSQVTYLQTGVFYGLTKLKHLYLQGNFLRMLDEYLFKDNLNIETLDLSQNNFMFLRDEPFRFLPNLKFLNISFNRLTSVKLGLRFQVTTKLETIDFSGNGIQYIFAEDFEPAQRWDTRIGKKMNFSKCGLKSIDLQALSDIRNIYSLGLGHNNQLEVDNITAYLSLMEDVQLKVLDISYTNCTAKFNVSDFSSENLGSLSIRGLNLAGNYIHEIDDHILTYMNMHWLDLSYNNLTSLSVGIGNLHALKYLDLSNNLISSICDEFKTSVGNLENLKISNNKLTDQSNLDIEQAVKLKHLDLSYNQFETFTVPYQLEQLETLILSHNKLQNINGGGPLVGLRNLFHISLSNNELTQLNDFLFRDSRNVEIAIFSGNKIATVSHQTFVPNCPKNIDLSRNDIQSVYHYGWHDIISINLHGNKIREIQPQAFFFLESLTDLDLGDNEISNLALEIFTHLSHLLILNLQDNLLNENLILSELLAPVEALQYIDISSNNFSSFDYLPLPFVNNHNLREIRMSSNFIKTISPSVFSGLEHLQYVDFSHNPFHCACDLLALQDWCKTNAAIVGNQENYGYICRSPKMRGSQTLLDYTVNTFECNGYLLHITIFSSVGGGAMLLSVTIGTVCWLWKKYRNKHKTSNDIEKENLNLIGYKKLNKSGGKKGDNDTSSDEALHQWREHYLRNNPSDTLIDVEFEYPKIMNGNIPNGVISKSKDKTESKDTKSKKKKAGSKKKKNKHTSLNGVVHDGKGVRFQNGYCSHTRSSLRKILSAMDKEYKKKQEKKQEKREVELKKEKKHRSRGNRDLVRLVSLRGSRSMPNVLSYIESLPRRRYVDHYGNRYTTVPIHHVDHIDDGQQGWTTSLVELPKLHRSSTVSGALNRYEYVDIPRVHRSSGVAGNRIVKFPRNHRSLNGAVNSFDPEAEKPRSRRLPNTEVGRYNTYEPDRVRRSVPRLKGIPDGYNTIASTRERSLLDCREPWTSPKTLNKTKSASNQDNLSKWL